MTIKSLVAQNLQTPRTTSYAWDISHTLVTTYHPYCQSPSALTEYLKQRLRHQRAKHLGRSPSTQVEQHVPLERSINSDFTLAATIVEYLDRRGERNVPKRYLKEANWCKDGPLGTGYYIADPDDPSILIPIDFNFKHLQWGCTFKKKDRFAVERPAPVRYGLRIFDEERTQDRSCWGPIDGTPDEEELPNPKFKFGSEAGGDTPDPDIVIPKSQKEELDLTTITQLIPAHISKPPIQPRSLAGAMAQIASTTTLTDSLVARTLGTGISQGGNTVSAEGIIQTLFPSQHNRGDGGGDDPPEPHRQDPGKRKEGGSGGGGGGDDPNPSGGGGGGGSGPDPAGGRNAADPGALSDKMISKEPEIFTGDRDKVEEFMTSWSVYHGINKQTRVMNHPMSQTMLFFGYLRGPKMHLWIKKISTKLDRHIRTGGRETDKWIWDTMINDFAQNFQDVMRREKAEKKLFKLRMERGELDEYTSQFQQLAKLARYYEQTGMICQRYFQGLPQGLQESMIAFEPTRHYQTPEDWIKGAIRQHSKYLTYQSYFGGQKNFNPRNPNQRPTKQQWQQGFAKNPNAMDLTPGRTHARAALTDDERATLRQEGKCFKCRKKGHMSQDCLDRASQARSGKTKEDPKEDAREETKEDDAQIKQVTAEELVHLVRNMSQEEKDKVIQDVFMKDF